MVFNSAAFLFVFLPAVYILYRIVPGKHAKNLLLALASLIFYAFGGLRQVVILLLSAVWNYLFGLALRRESGPRRLFAALGVIGDLALLVIYKYAHFLLSWLPSVQLPEFIVPLGISFFTFHAVSYLVDSYRDAKQASRNPLRLFLYLAFFPRLLAGPIVRYKDAVSELDERSTSPADTEEGLRRFVRGLAKKLLISEGVGAVVNAVYALPMRSVSGALAWAAALCYCLQIYFDFSGYSDMALGLGRLFGFRFPENFDYPYISCTISEFWRRWHMSLNRWFTDYLYIPLGGNRKGKARTVFNKLVVFFCTGLWHGAGWPFILWGLWHGVFVSLEGLCKNSLEKWKQKFPGRLILRLYTLLAVIVGFVMFRAADAAQGFALLGKMFTFAPGGDPNAAFGLFTPARRLAFALGIFFSVPVVPTLRKKIEAGSDALQRAGQIAADILALIGLVLCVLALAGGSFSPFIYQQF